MKATVTLLLVGVVMASVPVFAQEAGSDANDYRTGYLGLGVTTSRLATEVSSPVSGQRIELSDRPTGIVGYGGFRFNPYIAMEGGIGLSGTAKKEWSNSSGSVGTETDIRTLTLSGLFFWPISSRFELFGKAGVAFADTSITTTISGGSDSARDRLSDQDIGLLVGGGFSLPFGDFAVRFDVDYLSYGPTSLAEFGGEPVETKLDDPISYSLRFQGNF